MGKSKNAVFQMDSPKGACYASTGKERVLRRVLSPAPCSIFVSLAIEMGFGRMWFFPVTRI